MTAARRQAVGGRRGFTLVEVLVVVTIVAWVAASVAVRWSGVAQSASAKATLARWAAIDSHLRTYARSRRRACLLVLDREQNRVQKRYLAREVAGPWESLGTGVAVGEVRVGGQRVQRRFVEIPFNVAGVAPTYGVAWSGPGERETWLVVAGVTGAATACETEGEWDAALDLVAD